jgi:hypothetical protein
MSNLENNASVRLALNALSKSIAQHLESDAFQDTILNQLGAGSATGCTKIGDSLYDDFIQHQRSLLEAPIQTAIEVFKIVRKALNASHSAGELRQHTVCRGVLTNKLQAFEESMKDESKSLMVLRPTSMNLPYFKMLVKEEFGLDVELSASATDQHMVFDISWDRRTHTMDAHYIHMLRCAQLFKN